MTKAILVRHCSLPHLSRTWNIVYYAPPSIEFDGDYIMRNAAGTVLTWRTRDFLVQFAANTHTILDMFPFSSASKIQSSICFTVHCSLGRYMTPS